MKADQLRLRELVDFSRGLLSLHGRRLVLHDMNAFAQLRKDLATSLGHDQMRRILTRFGYFWGEADAAAMKRIFRWDDRLELLKAGPQLHSLQGVVKSVVKGLRVDEEKGTFRMELVWHDSGEAQEHLAALGPSEEPVCFMLTGYASGYATYCFHRPVYFIEQKCRARGDRVCTALGMDAQSWGDRLRPHLPFFQADDVRGKVLTLTRQLRQREDELGRQRRQLGLPPVREAPEFVEVRSPAFARVLELAGRAAPYDTSVLITGESGSGKEVIARYIHRMSRRSDKPFLGVNCGALPETLLESELFGHKAGAFTGANEDRVGLFEQAGHGTLLLDEIGEISLAMQVKLLRVLQEQEILRVGESRPRRVHARIIATTNRNLAQAIRDGEFREDLYYRLAVIEAEVPPLRSRPEDILPLARHFVAKFAARLGLPDLRLDAQALDYLTAYRWPGNVRELENVIERAAVLSGGGAIQPQHLPPALLTKPGQAVAGGAPVPLAEAERLHIHRVLEYTTGNRGQAAKVLGISPSTLWRKLRES